jgi:hypothetical protein
MAKYKDICNTTDVGGWRLARWRFTGKFSLKLHRECLFRGFRGRNARLEIIEGSGLTMSSFERFAKV